MSAGFASVILLTTSGRDDQDGVHTCVWEVPPGYAAEFGDMMTTMFGQPGELVSDVATMRAAADNDDCKSVWLP